MVANRPLDFVDIPVLTVQSIGAAGGGMTGAAASGT